MEKNSYKVIEEKWQKKWAEQGVFEASNDEKRDKFFATVPYPYANSVLHIGHGRAYTTADLYVRYQRLLGKNVLFPMAYHISGTPVLAVSDSIKRGDEKQIAMTRDAIADYIEEREEQDKLLEKFHDPYEIASFFSGTIKEALQSIGISVDWRREFTTGDEIYNKFVEWQYKKLYEAGILVQGRYPVLYSPDDKNAVGEDDIKDGDTDKVTIQEMTYLLFERRVFEDSSNNWTKEFFVATTLRPDALFGTTNLWLHPNHEYVRIRVGEQFWIVDKEAIVKLEHQFDDVEILSEHTGKEFIGEEVITPITQKNILIAEAHFIDSQQGTGVVYSSPAGSPEDFMALTEAKAEGRLNQDVEVINTVESYDKKGNKIEYSGSCPAEDKCRKFGVENSSDKDALDKAKQELYKEEHFGGKLNENAGELAGVYIKNAKEEVFNKLEDKQLGGIFYDTSRKAKTRGGSRVIVANLEDQWFLDYRSNEVKDKAHNLLDKMSYNPEKLKDSQKGYINWAEMRPCARRRGIGTALPQDPDWVIEPLSDSTLYPMLYLIQHIIAREQIQAEQLGHDVFEYVYLEEGNLTIIAEKHNLSVEILKEMRQEVEYWRGFDLRYTGVAHMSNHLTFLIYHYGLIFSEKYWPNNITVGGMLIKNGEKISKSKGNGLPLQRVGNVYGADLYRLYVALASNYDSELDFRDDSIPQLEKKFTKWIELIRQGCGKNSFSMERATRLQKWIISRFYSRVEEYFSHFKDLRIRESYVSILYEFLNDVSYFERRATQEELEEVMSFIGGDYLILMTPATPHMCEELWVERGEEGYVSLQEFKTQYSQYINKEIEDIESIAQELLSSISRIKEQQEIAQITKITIVQAGNQKFSLFDKLSKLLKENTPPKEIFSKLQEDFPQEKKFIGKFVPKTLGGGLSTYLEVNEEKEFLEEFSSYIEEEFSCEVEIVQDEDLKTSALPGRPGVEVK